MSTATLTMPLNGSSTHDPDAHTIAAIRRFLQEARNKKATGEASIELYFNLGGVTSRKFTLTWNDNSK